MYQHSLKEALKRHRAKHMSGLEEGSVESHELEGVHPKGSVVPRETDALKLGHEESLAEGEPEALKSYGKMAKGKAMVEGSMESHEPELAEPEHEELDLAPESQGHSALHAEHKEMEGSPNHIGEEGDQVKFVKALVDGHGSGKLHQKAVAHYKKMKGHKA